MTATLTYQNVRAIGALSLDALLDFRMTCRMNDHARAYVSGTVDAAINLQELEGQIKGGTMTVTAAGEDRPLFCGVILDACITAVNDYYQVEIWLISGSYLLDTKKRSQSFQDIQMTYNDVIKKTMSATAGADCIMMTGAEEKVKIPIIQYRETDWAFCQRLASHFGASLLPELSLGKPKFWLGMPEASAECDFDLYDYAMNLSGAFYEHGGESQGMKRTDFFHYTVRSYQDYQIGTRTVFDGKSLVICEKECYFEKGTIIFKYKLALPTFLKTRWQYNEKICGMSILGTVLETAGETLKIHLDIDPSQDAATAYPYSWTPDTGNLMYLMPKIGTRVALYFYDEDERSAQAIHCVRTNGGAQCPETQNYENRYLTTEHNKRYYFFPTVMGLVGTSPTATPLHMQMDDTAGITFQSHNKLNILARDKISVQAPIVRMRALSELIASHATLSVEGGDGDTPLNVVARPIATMDLAAGLNNLKGQSVKYIGTKPKKYPPLDDSKLKKPFSIGEAAMGILGGIAAGVASGLTFGVAAGAIAGAVGIATTEGMAINAADGGPGKTIKEFFSGVSGVAMKTGASVLSVQNAVKMPSAIAQTAGLSSPQWSAARKVSAPISDSASNGVGGALNSITDKFVKAISKSGLPGLKYKPSIGNGSVLATLRQKMPMSRGWQRGVRIKCNPESLVFDHSSKSTKTVVVNVKPQGRYPSYSKDRDWISVNQTGGVKENKDGSSDYFFNIYCSNYESDGASLRNGKVTFRANEVEDSVNIKQTRFFKVYLSPSDQPGNGWTFENITINGSKYTTIKFNEVLYCREMASLVSEKLKNQSLGIEVKIGTNNSETIKDKDKRNLVRANESNSFGADLHLAIHTNASGYGCEVFYDTERRDMNSWRIMFDHVSALYNSQVGRPSPYKGQSYNAIELNQSNAKYLAYLEIAYHDNLEDATWLLEKKKDISQAIVNGIIDILKQG